MQASKSARAGRTVALMGNPNSGKTTLFNRLTGSNQHVGNWPGVTVEKKEGYCEIEGARTRVVDLPGVYSLSPFSQEEIIARDYIVRQRPDVIVVLVDATNLARNLYFSLLIMELERPVVIALNMMDEVRARGESIDVELLARRLGAAIVPISAREGEGIEALKAAIARAPSRPATVSTHWLPQDALNARDQIAQIIEPRAQAAGLPAHWAALKLMENDARVRAQLAPDASAASALDALLRAFASRNHPSDLDVLLPDMRYQSVGRMLAGCVKAPGGARETLSQRIDRVVLSRVWAMPIFFLLMFAIFAMTFGWPGSALTEGMQALLDWMSGGVRAFMEATLAPEWVVGLVVDGALAGAFSVLGFLPQILLLFLFLTLLEDSGYMARVAFIMDRPLRRLGLSGKSFIPMLMGFGCTTPAVMGARTMENTAQRRMTILLTPFMSCSARLPVYALFAGVFFAGYEGVVVFSLYMIGLLVAILTGLLLRGTLFRKGDASFVMELPPYRMPQLEGTLRQLMERARGFLVRAGSVILAMSVVIWLLQNFSVRLALVSDAEDSILSSMGRFIAPLFAPLGYGDWRASVSLLTGFIAKESVAATLGVLYGFTEGSGQVLAQHFTPLTAYGFLCFVLLYVPCVSAFASIRREMNSTRWALLSAGLQVGWAYAVALLVFQLGRLAGLT